MAAHSISRLRFYIRAALLLLVFWAALVRFMVMLPPLEGTDEIAHFGYIAYVRQNGSFPPLETDNPIVLQETGQPPLYYALAVAWSLLEPDYDWHTWQGVLLHNPWADFNKPVASLDNINQFMLGAHHIPDSAAPGIERAVRWLRFPSLLMGLLSAACAIAAGRRLFSPSTALFAGMLFAFTMTLVLMFSFVTNDALMTLAGTAVTYGCVRILTQKSRLRFNDLFLTGVMAAVGVLTKAGGLVFLPVMGAALFLSPQFSLLSRYGTRATHVSPLRAFIKNAVILLAIPTLAAALWYGYMLVTYNDPFGMAAHLNRSWVRTEPIDVLTALPLNDFLSFRSFWGGMANGYLIPANWIFIVPLSLVVLAIVGGIKSRMHHAPSTDKIPVGAQHTAPEKLPLYHVFFSYRIFLVLALIFLAMVAAYARWMTQFYVLSGRLMLPGYLALVLLVVMGLRHLPGFRRIKILAAGWSIFVTLIYAGYVIYPQVYGVNLMPPEAVPPLQGTAIRYGDVELMGYRITPERLRPGDVPQVELCWRSLKTDERMAVPYAFSFQIVGADDTIYYRRESYPGMGSYTYWKPGLAFCDHFTAQSEKPLLPAQGYRIVVQMVNPETQAVLHPNDDITHTGIIAASGEALPPETTPLVTLDGIYLLSNTLERYDNRIEIQAEWATGSWTTPRPVTVFFHVMQGETLLTQIDQPLIEGYPALLWGQNERVGSVRYTIELPPEAAGKSLAIYMGIYAEDGTRLTVTDSQFPVTPDNRVLTGTLDE